jgi:hypothetical protein
MLTFEVRRARIPKDDLLKNIIFVAFRDVHQELWSKIGESGMVVCIPHSLSIVSRKDRQENCLVLDEAFLFTHTLQLASYVPGIGAGNADPAFKYYSNLKGQTLKYSVMTNTITTLSKFENDRMCLIADEHLIYDDQLRKITVWILDRPFFGPYKDILASREDTEGISSMYDNFLGKSEEFFLHLLGDSFCENAKRHTQQFIDSYVFVKGYSKFTMNYLNRLCKDIIDWNDSADLGKQDFILAMNHLRIAIDAKFKYACSIEYIQGLLYPKLFRESCHQYAFKDNLLKGKLSC